MNFNPNLLAALAQAQQAQQNQNKNLLQFKAGKLSKDGKMMVPDKRKGRVVLTIEDQLLHFQWKEREAAKPELDVIIFPSEAKYFKVDKVKDGRVYCLDFKDGTRQLFFWMQEPKTDRDEEYLKRVNEILESPPLSNDYTTQQQSMFQNFQTNAQTKQTQPQRSQIQLDQFNQILQGLGAPRQPQQPAAAQPPSQPASQPSSQPSSQQQQQQPSSQNQQQVIEQLIQQQQQLKQFSLRDVLKPDALCAVLLKYPELAAKLHEFLPTGTPNDIHSICEHVRSAPFQQTVSTFNHALVSGQLGGFLVSMGLPSSVGSIYGGGVQGFLNAVQKQNDDKKDDDKMDTS